MSLTTLRKESRKKARRANKKVAPVASDARASAVKYAESTHEWAAPRVSAAKDWATPKVEAARDWTAPKVEPAMTKVKEDMLPKVAGAVTAALVASEPVRDEAMHRGSAAIAALKGELSPPPVRRKRRMRTMFLLLGVIGGAVAGWKAWARSRAGSPDPWATPVGGPGYSAGTSTHPVTDDAAGASPDEALADAADEASVSLESPGLGTENNTLTGASTAETESVPPERAKRAKNEADAGRVEPRP